MALEIGEGHLSHFVSFTAAHPNTGSASLWWNGNFPSKFGERGDDQLSEPGGLSIQRKATVILLLLIKVKN